MRHLQPVLRRRREQAQGAVDRDRVALGHGPLHPVDQPVELEPAEDLAIPRGALVADLGLDPDRPEQHRLRQGHVVAVDQPLRRHVLEREHAVLVPEVREEPLEHRLGRDLELARDGGEDLVAVERGPRAVPDRRLLVRSRPAGLQRLAVLGGGGEDLLADQVGGDVGDDLELGAVFQHLGQPAVHEGRLAPAAEQVVDLLLDLAAGHPHPLAEDRQQALGRLEPLRAVAIQVERDHPLLGESGPGRDHRSA